MKTKLHFFMVMCSVFYAHYTFSQVTQPTNAVSNANSYLGTSNNYDVVFKRMGVEAGKLTTNSVSLGVGAKSINGGISIGTNAGKYSITTYGFNIFIGNETGRGMDNVSNTGRYNTFIGHNIGSNNSTGYGNTFLGYSAGGGNTVGNQNIAIGYMAGKNSVFNDNIFIGNYSGCEEGFGGNKNIIIGNGAGFLFCDGIGNNLIIDNSDDESEFPLIWGNFAEDKLKFNGKVCIGIGIEDFPINALADVSNYNLCVKGGILTEELLINLQSNWADYVFEKEYKLPTLQEVEYHIKEKGHLINVPSAKEVAENGIKIGEMTKIQQEKIEELTLYIIELNKKIEALEKKILNN